MYVNGFCTAQLENGALWELFLIILFFTFQSPVIPPTITDQVRLWELERDRLTFTDGVLYNQFLSQSDFEMLRDYAKVCVWGVLVCTHFFLGYFGGN